MSRHSAGASSANLVEQAIADAARRTGIDFSYLLAQARVESSLDPSAKAPKSSASGLYQFIESTWLDTLKRHGDRFGLTDTAQQISLTDNGTAFVSNTAQREAILALRANPQISSLMAAGLAQDNRELLKPVLGREPTHSELYLAHFLGAGGASRFVKELRDDPSQTAADLFARPAAANPRIFYSESGSPRTLAEVLSHLTDKLQVAGAVAVPVNRAGYNPDASRKASASAYSARVSATPSPRQSTRQSGDAAMSRPALGVLPMQSPVKSPSSVPTSLTPISQVLRDMIGETAASNGEAPVKKPQIERAYRRLKAFGL
ncbi:MAG: transglycosylase SLT domain-containing protein [Pseudomonadota bacterium]